MNANTKKTFYYHSDASALGGIVEHPVTRTVDHPASVSLAQAGGHSTTSADRFSIDGLLAFDRAHVTVSGKEIEDEEGWRTIATSCVEGLHLMHVVTADRIVSQVSIMRFHDDRPAEVSFNGSQFVNLRVNGTPVITKANLDLMKPCDDQGQTRKSSRSRLEDMLTNAHQQFEDQEREDSAAGESNPRVVPPRFVTMKPKEELAKKGTFLCSLVKEVEVEKPATAYGHRIHVPDFGNIFLGEMRLSLFSTQLTMLRVEMGCMGRGSMSVGTSNANGSTMP